MKDHGVGNPIYRKYPEWEKVDKWWAGAGKGAGVLGKGWAWGSPRQGALGSLPCHFLPGSAFRGRWAGREASRGWVRGEAG